MELHSDYKAKYPVLTLEKAIDVMKYMSANASPEGITITELSDNLGLSKNNVHRILDTLLASELVDRLPGKQSYMLGWGLYELSKTVPTYHNINTSDYISVMGDLCSRVSESVNMGICSGNNECIILCKVNPNRSTLISTQVGSVEPLHVAALGKVFMSEWPTKQIVDYFDTIRTKKVTQKSIDNAEQMISECLETRRRGYAIDDEERTLGVRCMAVPIFNYGGNVSYCIGISAPKEQITEKTKKQYISCMKKYARQISNELGYGLYHKV